MANFITNFFRRNESEEERKKREKQEMMKKAEDELRKKKMQTMFDEGVERIKKSDPKEYFLPTSTPVRKGVERLIGFRDTAYKLGTEGVEGVERLAEQQKSPFMKTLFEQEAQKARWGGKGVELLTSIPGEVVRETGRRTQFLTDPLKAIKRAKGDPLETAIDIGTIPLDIPTLGGAGLFAGGLKKVIRTGGKEVVERGGKEIVEEVVEKGEKGLLQELFEKSRKSFSSLFEKVGKEEVEKSVREVAEKDLRELVERGIREEYEKVGREVVEKEIKEATEEGVEQVIKKGERELTEKTVKEAVENVTSKYAGGINVKRLGVTEAGERVLKETAEILEVELKQLKNVPQEVIDDLSKELVGKPGLTHEQVLKELQQAEILRQAIPEEEMLKMQASTLKTKQALASVSEQIAQAQGNAPKKVWDEYWKLRGIVKSTNQSMGSGLQSLRITPKAKSVFNEMVDDITEIGVKNDEIMEAAKGVNFANANEATKFYRKFVKPTPTELVDFFRYANILSSPKTQVINLLGNLFQFPLAVAEKAVAGPIDLIAATLTRRERAHYLREVPPYVRGFLNSIPDAYEGFVKALKGEIAVTRPDVGTMSKGQKLMRRLPPYTEGVKGAAVKVMGLPLRAMEAGDVFFRTMFKSAAEESLEYKAKRGTPDLSKEAIDFLAEKDAMYRVFRGELGNKEQGYLLQVVDFFSKKMYSLRKDFPVTVGGKKKTIYNPVKFTIPFIQTTMEILKQGLERSPIGFFTVPGAADKTMQYSRAIVGSIIAVSAAYAASITDVTMTAPDNKKDKEFFYASGRKPYSIRVGNHWIQYSRIGPAAFPIMMAVGMKEYLEKRDLSDSQSKAFAELIGSYVNFFFEQSYLDGVANLMAALQGKTYGIERMLATYPRQLIPASSFLGWWALIVDNVYRDPKTVKEEIQKGIPYLSKQLEPYRTPTGEESTRDYPLFHAASPFTVSKVKPGYEGYFQAREKSKELRADRERVIELLLEGNKEEARKVVEETGVDVSVADMKRRAKSKALEYLIQGNKEKAREIVEMWGVDVTKGELREATDLYEKMYKSLPKSTRPSFARWYEEQQEIAPEMFAQ